MSPYGEGDDHSWSGEVISVYDDEAWGKVISQYDDDEVWPTVGNGLLGVLIKADEDHHPWCSITRRLPPRLFFSSSHILREISLFVSHISSEISLFGDASAERAGSSHDQDLNDGDSNSDPSHLP